MLTGHDVMLIGATATITAAFFTLNYTLFWYSVIVFIAYLILKMITEEDHDHVLQ